MIDPPLELPRDPALPLEGAATELSLAVGQLLRRLRMESNPSEMTWSQLATLARLDKTGWMTTAELARAESVKPQSMSTMLADLEQEGRVQRRPHPTDGRQVLFGITADGIEARRKRSIAKRAWLLSAMTQLDPDEQRTLIAAIPLIKRLGDSCSARNHDDHHDA